MIVISFNIKNNKLIFKYNILYLSSLNIAKIIFEKVNVYNL